MIEKDLSCHVLTIGTDYKPCNGGISVLINGYTSFYEKFYFIKSSGPGNKIIKLLYFVESIVLLISYCIFLKRIKLIHIHSSSFSFLWREKWYVYIGHFFHKKVILHLHGGTFELVCKSHIRVLQKAFNKVDMVICVSEYMASIVKKYKLTNKVHVVFNFIEPSSSEFIHKNEDVVVVSFLGTICKNKGVFDILEMIRQNKDYLKGKVSFNICGQGDTPRLMEIINRYNLKDIIEYKGFVSGDEKRRLLGNTDIYFQPSYFEAFGISILEAMSYGAVIISTNIGGIPEIVDSSVGLLVSPGDTKEMFSGLKYFIENRKVRNECSKNAIQKSKKFYVSYTERDIKMLYKKMLN